MQAPSTENWTQDHYLAFIALYGANADAQLNPDEQSFMKQHFGEPVCDEVSAFFSALSDSEAINTIYNLRNRFFPGEDSKQEILDGLKEIFESDHVFSRLEHAIMAVWDKMI